MVKSVEAITDEIIDLDEFRVRVLSKIDRRCPESLLAMAGDLVALSNNRRILADKFLSVLSGIDGPRRIHGQSCVIDEFGDFLVRINIWDPVDSMKYDAASYGYGICHNHDFSFITTKFYGFGYLSESYLYSESPDDDVGKVINLDPQGEILLRRGWVTFYEEIKDVHVVYPPEERAASLNLVRKSDSLRKQFYFDVRSSSIIGRVDGRSLRRESMERVNRYLFLDSLSLHDTNRSVVQEVQPD